MTDVRFLADLTLWRLQMKLTKEGRDGDVGADNLPLPYRDLIADLIKHQVVKKVNVATLHR